MLVLLRDEKEEIMDPRAGRGENDAKEKKSKRMFNEGKDKPS